MENITEVITQLFNDPRVVAILTTIIGWITANIGTLIIFACKYIKAKNREVKEKALHHETIEALTVAYEEKVNELCDKVENSIDELDAHVCERINTNEEIRKEEIKEQTVQLEEAISETKKSLNIDEILEEK